MLKLADTTRHARSILKQFAGVGACPEHCLSCTFPRCRRASVTCKRAKPSKEEMLVPIGGIEQWITIKGDDRNHPVVLMLHGGPGDAVGPTFRD